MKKRPYCQPWCCDNSSCCFTVCLPMPQPEPPPPPPTPSISVAYFPNGGDGGLVDANITPGASYSIKTAAAALVSRPGFGLLGWNTEPDGSGIDFAPGQIITLENNLELYAQWADFTPLPIVIASYSPTNQAFHGADIITYSGSVSNANPYPQSILPNAQITIQLDTRTTFRPATLVIDGQLADSSAYHFDESTFALTLFLGSIAGQETVTFSFRATVRANANIPAGDLLFEYFLS